MRFLCGFMMLAMACVLSFGDAADAQLFGNTESELEPEPERLPDPVRGQQLFNACLKCHTVVPGEVKIGPSLAGVVGRRPGSIPDFGYSQDMINFGASGVLWNEDNLDQFLIKPRALINGTKMVFQGFRKQADRDDIIAYLLTIRG